MASIKWKKKKWKLLAITQISPEELQVLITNSINSVLAKQEQHKTVENLYKRLYP